jgi:hypothetical protein
VEKHGRDGETTDGMIKRPACIACWITKATDTHKEYVTLLGFARQLWLCEAPQRQVTGILPLLLRLRWQLKYRAAEVLYQYRKFTRKNAALFLKK